MHSLLAFGSSAISALSIVLLSTELPSRVASHFNAAGVPDSFMPRNAFVALMLIFASVLPLGIWWLQVTMARNAKVKIPNPEVWFSDLHRGETLRWLYRHAAIGSAGLSAFLTFVFWLTVVAHRQTPVALPQYAFWTALSIFLAATFLWVYWQHRRFRRVG